MDASGDLFVFDSFSSSIIEIPSNPNNPPP